jgi:PAS domain S-box-containing protein
LAVSAPVLILSAVVEQLTRAAAELRREQAQFRSVVEDQTELICRFLPDGTFTFVNGAYCRYFGRGREDLLGRTFWQFIPESGHAAARDFLASITPEHPVATREHEVIGPEGDVRWQQWTDRGLFDEDGQLLEYQAVGRDVTDRRRAEEEHRLLESQRRVEETLREADRRKDEFLAVLAHELRNPLAPISLSVESLRLETLTPEAMNARDVIGRQVKQITRLVDDLLDISRITLGKIALTLESADVVGVVTRAVQGIRPVIEARRHQLSVSLPGHPVHARCDPARLAQIVSNLLDNAAKYTDPGGRIYLVLERQGGDVLLTVGDNGRGIAGDQLPKIFEPFTQLRGSPLTAEQGGLGIGLTLVRRLVELHGGRVSARSEGLGMGSEFVVRLAALPDAPEVKRRVAEPEAPLHVPMKVLVVDDNVDGANSLARLLSVLGHTVRVANDGESALEIEGEFAPEAVLLDLQLPRLDGLEVARRIRRRHRSEPPLLVAVTGFGQPADRRRTADAGFDHHFTKPVGIDALESLLSAWGSTHGRSSMT